MVTVTDPEDRGVDCGRVEVTFVLAHDSHGHAEKTVNGCAGSCRRWTTTSPTAATCGASSAPPTPTSGGVGGTPPLTTVSQQNVRQKLQQVEFALNQSGTNTGTNTDLERRPAPREPRRR